MKLLSLFVMATFAVAFAAQIQAQQLGPAPAGCYKDLWNKVTCPPMGGEVYVTISGKAVCGKGRCVRDLYGKVTCSTQPAGQVRQDVNGKVTCVGSCEEASPANCQQLQ